MFCEDKRTKQNLKSILKNSKFILRTTSFGKYVVVVTKVHCTSLGSHVGKPNFAYGWSGGFYPGCPVFALL